MTWQEELEMLHEKHGGLLLPSVVEKYARNAKTALHDEFVWDDTRAAHLWRLHQARNLIRAVVQVTEGSSLPVRVYVSLTEDRHADAGYRTLDDVMRSEAMRDSLLVQARRDMRIFTSKYRTLTKLADVIGAMERTEAQMSLT